ncbi:MAG: hypothetical protein GX950_03710 [Candidatus Diapherotrites archaeon]|uniref:ATP-cone domain-containing protein n=1 Tax=Candidatus Iainarchaeum sp. TaxID=3101447 RepID=A0A7K4C0P3_9ARCH|nr:hypothetical protein [Candidatus Diapherotrites archaeon]
MNMKIIEEKIQIIAKEIMEANASPWTITKIVKELSEMNTTSEKKLREKSQKLLEELDPQAAIIYNKFNQMKVYTSNEKILPFNRGHIIKSLLKETNLPRNIAEKITLEVENQIKDAKIETLNTTLIRELVNSKLISYNYEEVRNNYARLGEAAHDIRKKLEEKPYFGEGVREYNTALVLPKKARKLHCEGTIHIEDTMGYSSRVFSHTHIFEKFEDEDETISQNIKKIIEKQKLVFTPISIYGATHTLSEFCDNPNQSKKIGKKLIKYLEILPKETKISIELFTPEILKTKSNKTNALLIGEQLIEKKESIISIDSTYELKLLKKLNKQLTILNCSEKEYYPQSENIYSTTPTINSFINLNLEKIAQENNFEEFIKEIKEISEEVKKIENQRNEILSKKQFLNKFSIEKNKTGIGITNLHTLTKYFQEMKPSECVKKINKEINTIFSDEIILDLTKIAQNKFKEINLQNVENEENSIMSESKTEHDFLKTAKTIKEVEEMIKEKIKIIQFGE